MSTKEANRLHMMKLVMGKKISIKKASEELGISERQGWRLWAKFQSCGIEGLLSVRRGRPSPNRISPDIIEQALVLIRDNYDDFGPTFAAEKLKEKHQIKLSSETLRKAMIKAEIWKPKKRRKLQLHQRRTRRSRFGELIQIDGSYHAWFEDRADKCCLLVFVDDATSKIMEMRFCRTETIEDYAIAMKAYLNRYGRPLAIYSDRHTIFRSPRGESQQPTQFGRALEELKIDLICANSPQAKGRVERKHGLLQDRLIKEMRLRKISSPEEGNKYLPEFIDWHNLRFAKEASSPEDAHRSLEKGNLDRIFACQAQRVLSKDLTFSYKNKLYMIQTDRPVYAMKRAQIKVIEYGVQGIAVEYQGKVMKYVVWKEMTQQARVMESKEIEALWPETKKRGAGKKHPWR